MKLILMVLLLINAIAVMAGSSQTITSNKQYTGWIEQMKTAPRGPFTNIKWFCNDGSIQPPKAYACSQRGGGRQHGNYSDKSSTLRSEGFYIANVLSAIDIDAFLKQETYIAQYNQLLIEKFLIQIDNGWIMRKAQFYRGAIQEEDERSKGRELLIALLNNKDWLGHRFLGLYSGMRLIPHGKDTASAQKVRQMAASLAEHDKGFTKLRVKIHGSPDAADAHLVREYSETVTDKSQYLELADEIDQLYQLPELSIQLRTEAKIYTAAPWLQQALIQTAQNLEDSHSAQQQYAISAQLLADLRNFMPRIKKPSARLKILDLSLNVEAFNFKLSTELRQAMAQMSRKQHIHLLQSAALAAYGTGYIKQREYQQIKQSIARINHNNVLLNDYAKELNYLGRVPGWGTQNMRFQFYRAMQKLGQIEALSYHFIQDQLRGSSLLFFSQALNELTIDVNRLSGVKHSLFGNKIGIGFNALNPGLVRGTLHTDLTPEQLPEIQADGIYVLPETVSDLPPLAGIITAGEGNPLSHVQLLARNLGIPNVTINEEMIGELKQHNKQIIIMAVSPAGLVELHLDSDKWRNFFNVNQGKSEVVIRPDLDKLDVKFREFIQLTQLRAADSGRIVGPKAAKLGELKYIYPQKVANGLAIPFGIFREVVLDKPYKNTSKTVLDWMIEQYAQLRTLESTPVEHDKAAEVFRAELYDIIIHSKINDKFVQSLRQALQDTFGSAESGVFVRSDTNVEDLPDFTGAGLNLTMPNVIGFDNLLDSINKVWASPFTRRAFAWRQSHMEKPEYVYPSILLLSTVASDKSGVMVTADIDTGDSGIISVAVNEGVGGAVDGQSAESLRINLNDASVRVLATATAATQRQPSAKGGLLELPVSGADSILQPDEIKQLIIFVKELPEKFPSIVNDAGKPAPADVEFGFVDGQLKLFQIRPFLDSHSAQGNSYLANMDKALNTTANVNVDMNGVPEE